MRSRRFDADIYARRLSAATAATAKAGLAGLVITPGYDLQYLIGSRAQTFERLTALVLPVSGDPSVVVPRLELASLKESAVPELGLTVRDWVDGENPYRLVADALGGAKVAVTESMPALHLLPLTDVLGVTPVLATGVLRDLRMVKDAAEVDMLRTAGAAIDRVHARVPGFLAPGRREADVAADIAEVIVAEGHSEVAFVIVGSGPHSADPHHSVRIANCRPVTWSSSTSAAPAGPATTRTRRAPTASANRIPKLRSIIRCCSAPSAPLSRQCVRE